MAKKRDNLLLIAGIGVGAYLLWKKSATQPPAPLPASNLTPTLTGNYSAPTLGTGSAATPLPSTANDQRVTEIKQWISSLSPGNQAAALSALAVMSQAEIAGLYDIVHNDFYGNGITTSQQRAFWDAWRTKYHVADGTYA
jgi:hypothetical protein